MNKLLIIHPGALGDILLTIPFISKLADNGVSITLVAMPWLLELKQVFRFVKNWKSLDLYGLHRLFSEDFVADDLSWVKDYDMIIAFFRKDSEPLMKNLNRLTIPFICESFIPPPYFRQHISVHLSSIFKRVLHASLDNEMPDEKTRAENSSGSNKVLLQPGSGNILKNWPLMNFLTLAEGLKKSGMEPVFVTGPAEAPFLPLLKESGNKVITSTSLPRLVELMRGALAFVGNDSGTSHLASFFCRRNVILFGPTDPVVWAPSAANAHVVYKPLPCSPCIFRNNIVSCSEARCMQSITVDDVLGALLDIRS